LYTFRNENIVHHDYRKSFCNTREPHHVRHENLQTNIKGVFTAGDIREKTDRQITTAVADGTIAALNTEKFIKQRK